MQRQKRRAVIKERKCLENVTAENTLTFGEYCQSEGTLALVHRTTQRFHYFDMLRRQGPVFSPDLEVGAVMREYGNRKVGPIIDEAVRLKMTANAFNAETFEATLGDFFAKQELRDLSTTWYMDLARQHLLESLWRVIPKGKTLKPMVFETDEDVLKALPKPNASAGFLGLATGKKGKKANVREMREFAAQLRKQRKPYPPAVLGYRTSLKHLLTEDMKLNPEWEYSSRPIEVMSGDVTLVELRLGRPLMDALLETTWYNAGISVSERSKLINRLRFKYPYWLSIDYSRYDASLPAWLIRMAFNVIFELFGTEVPKDEAEWMIDNFIHCRIATKDGYRSKDHGVPSGSYFTQAIDSMCNYLMMEAFRIFHKLPPAQFLIVGDDNLSFWTIEVNRRRLSKFVWERFRVKLSPDKCGWGRSVKDDPHYLSTDWTFSGAARNLKEIVVKAIAPERPRDYAATGIDPRLILYAYYFCYPETMRRCFDIQRLKRDLGIKKGSQREHLDDAIVERLPGLIQYEWVYLDEHHSLDAVLGLTV